MNLLRSVRISMFIKNCIMAVAVICICFLVVKYEANKVDAALEPAVLTVRRLEIVDVKGQPRISLSVDNEGYALIDVSGNNHGEGIQIEVSNLGESSIQLLGENSSIHLADSFDDIGISLVKSMESGIFAVGNQLDGTGILMAAEDNNSGISLINQKSHEISFRTDSNSASLHINAETDDSKDIRLEVNDVYSSFSIRNNTNDGIKFRVSDTVSMMVTESGENYWLNDIWD